MSDRARTFALINGDVLARCISAIHEISPNFEKPWSVSLVPYQKKRTNKQNELLWAGPLRDYAEQFFVNGLCYSEKVWHEHLKREFLPEEETPGLTKAGYTKWEYTPSGERVLVGSTGDLTTKGFSDYIEKIYAEGAKAGIRFSEKSTRYLIELRRGKQ